MSIKPLLALIPCALTLILSGCGDEKDPYQGMTPQVIYATGHSKLQEGSYSAALKAYQSLDSQYPFTDETKRGDIDSVYAYYQNDDPAMAMTAAARYLKQYPGDPHADYAYYMMGVVNFENGRGFLQTYFPYDMAQHEAANYTNAFNNFSTVVTQYSASPYATDARRRMVYLMDTLAQYNLNVAQFLFSQKAYVGATQRAWDVVIHYPSTPQVKPALALIAQAYRELGLQDLAASTTAVQALNFPK